MERELFTSESVSSGHPDKLADQISDAILDEILKNDPNGRVACETLLTTGLVFVSGEISTTAYVDVSKVARGVLYNVGYTDDAFGIDSNSCGVIVSIDEQSPDISMGVNETSSHEQGAGDQGLMFGYACRETPELMPLPIMLSHKLLIELERIRKAKILPYLRPDAKSQVTIEYDKGVPKRADAVVISTQHNPEVNQAKIKEDLLKEIIKPILGNWFDDDTKVYVNPTGQFIKGGPNADTGLTGRKIIVDTYGGIGRHGGGAFSGKDPSKVDRSATYMARYIAKNLVASEIADEVEIQLSYAIGVADPISIRANSFNTGKVSDEILQEIIRKVFRLKPGQIISDLNLKRPIYQKTASYGHFGREDDDFTWEKTDKVEEIVKIWKTYK